MFNRKVIVFIFVSLLGNALYAKQDPDMVSYKDYKEKKVSNVQEKKPINITKTSKNPKGNFQKGQIASESFLKTGTMINTNKYENIKNTDIYRINNKIFRISRETNEILAVLN